jgi:hypothetical protein
VHPPGSASGHEPPRPMRRPRSSLAGELQAVVGPERQRRPDQTRSASAAGTSRPRKPSSRRCGGAAAGTATAGPNTPGSRNPSKPIPSISASSHSTCAWSMPGTAGGHSEVESVDDDLGQFDDRPQGRRHRTEGDRQCPGQGAGGRQRRLRRSRTSAGTGVRTGSSSSSATRCGQGRARRAVGRAGPAAAGAAHPARPLPR